MASQSFDNGGVIRTCFKCDEPVYQNLNVIYNALNSTIILWNKFQIYVYENLDFECASRNIIPEFQINNVIMSSNYLMCVDSGGNVHTISLHFKNAAPKRFKYSFQPRENGVMASAFYGEDCTICLQYDSGAYILIANKINKEFNVVRSAIVMCFDRLPLQPKMEDFILKSYPIAECYAENVKKIFSMADVNIKNDYSIVVISFDSKSVYSCLFSTKATDDQLNLVKLYTCPSTIAAIDFISSTNFNIIIALKIGTLVNLNLSAKATPTIIHLNTAIQKCLAFENTALYSNGQTLWQAEDILSSDIKFRQLFVHNVKDFTKFGDQLICTTYSHVIYIFSLKDKRSYVKPLLTPEYCTAEKLLDNTRYFGRIVDTLEKNKSLISVLSRERDFITALSLSNRQDIMNNILKQKVIVYESYEEALSENKNIHLTNKLSEYLDNDCYYFLIDVTMCRANKLSVILSNYLGDLRVHTSFISDGQMIKTNSVKVDHPVLTLLIPMKKSHINMKDMKVHFKLLTNIPGALDTNQKLWTLLYRKTTVLHSAHFLAFGSNEKKCFFLKKPQESLEVLMLEMATNQYGNLVQFTDTRQNGPGINKWNVYVRLPNQFDTILRSGHKDYSSKKVNYFIQKFASESFKRGQSYVNVTFRTNKVHIVLVNDSFSNPCLKISSNNVKIALNMRNFLSDIVYNAFTDYVPRKEFINHSYYVAIENLQKAIQESIDNDSDEDFLPLIEQFERKVVGVLPI